MRKALTTAIVGLVLAGCAPEQEANTGGGDQASSCATDQLNLEQDGRLTVGTDNPAFPPWFGGGTPQGSPWEINDPSTAKGFESAVAYAVAGELGFSEGDVQWVEVPFNQSFKPGPKDFDFDINQISYVPQRDEAVDFSNSYYEVNQALVALEGTPIASASSLEDLQQYTFGAQVGTTSFNYIEDNIQPSQDPSVYDTNNDAIRALKNGQIDGLVVDLPTAFYVIAVQVPDGVIVGQFPTIGAQEYFGMVFEDGNPLVECVNQALDRLKEDGSLQDIQQRWLADKADAPVFG